MVIRNYIKLLQIQLIIFLINLFVFCNPSAVFSEGMEYKRMRGTPSLTVEEKLLLDRLGHEYGTKYQAEYQAEYYIAPGDTIEVFVWQNPDLTRETTIRPDGILSYPLIGSFKAAGLTIDELQNKIQEKFSQYVKSPQVTISVKDYVGNKIIILGEIGAPGVYTYNGTMNLLEAIALAGDFNDNSKRESVIVVSDNLTEHPKVRRVNLFRAIRKGTSQEDIILKPNDLVYVPRHFIADFNKCLNELQPSVDKAMSIFTWRSSLRAWYKHTD